MDNQTNQLYGSQVQTTGGYCAVCGAALTPGQAFCAGCGTPAPTISAANICSNCGSEIPADAGFCARCGHKVGASAGDVNPAIAEFNSTVATQNQKKGKKKIAPIVIAVVTVIAIILGSVMFSSMQAQRRAEAIAQARETYIENANDFAELCLTAGINLEDIADTVQQYWYDAIWKDYYYGDIDIAISRAISAKSSAISQAKTYDSQIISLYNKLKYIPDGLENDYKIKALHDAVCNMYNVYQDYYNFATDPSGSYNSFSAANSTKTNSFIAAYNALKNLF